MLAVSECENQSWATEYSSLLRAAYARTLESVMSKEEAEKYKKRSLEILEEAHRINPKAEKESGKRKNETDQGL